MKYEATTESKMHRVCYLALVLVLPPPNCLPDFEARVSSEGQLRPLVRGTVRGCMHSSYSSVILILLSVLPKEMAPSQPGPQEIFLQVLNLADDEVKVTVLGNENNSLWVESIKSFQVRYGSE